MCDLLANYIGVKGCSDVAPESGIYINDYPGITTMGAANAADSETVRGQDLLLKCLAGAYKHAIHDILSEIANLGHAWKGAQIVEGVDFYLTGETVPALQVTTYDIELEHQFQVVQVNNIRVVAAAAGNLVIKYIGHATEEVTIPIVQGENNLVINKKLLDDTTIEIHATVETKQFGYVERSCHCLCFSGSTTNNAIWIVKFCDLCKVSYHYRESLTRVFYLKAAILYFTEMLASPQMGVETRFGKDYANKALVVLLGGQDAASGVIYSSEYNKAIKASAKALGYGIQKGDIPCFGCEKDKIVYNHP